MNGVGMRGLLLEAKGQKGPPPCFFRGGEGPGEICKRTCIIGAYFFVVVAYFLDFVHGVTKVPGSECTALSFI